MTSLKKTLAKAAATAAIGVGLFAITAGTASAYVVCNAAGDCWHTDQHVHYSREVQARVYPDSWYFHNDWDHDHDHHWRNHHDGRGFFRNGVWITF
jgi:hypothetical protein